MFGFSFQINVIYSNCDGAETKHKVVSIKCAALQQVLRKTETFQKKKLLA